MSSSKINFFPNITFTMAVVLMILEPRLLPKGNLLEGEGKIFGSTGRHFHDLDNGDASTSSSCECFNQDFLISAAVSEFKGPDIFGVVRLAQVNMELARIEANFSGLSPGKHGWSINEFGDLTRGAASTGKIFNPINEENTKEPLGDLGTLEANENGDAFYTGVKEKLRVADLIGRSMVVYATEDKTKHGITAAVIARSAGVGENYKKLCTCDGTTIWDATDKDFVSSKV